MNAKSPKQYGLGLAHLRLVNKQSIRDQIEGAIVSYPINQNKTNIKALLGVFAVAFSLGIFPVLTQADDMPMGGSMGTPPADMQTAPADSSVDHDHQVMNQDHQKMSKNRKKKNEQMAGKMSSKKAQPSDSSPPGMMDDDKDDSMSGTMGADKKDAGASMGKEKPNADMDKDM